MLLSVIICTYRRVEAARAVLECLAAQTLRDFEVLVVDGSGEQSVEHSLLRSVVEERRSGMDVRLLASAKGLPRQRNLGLDQARGELIAFFDDDVSFSPGFLQQAAELFRTPGLSDVGGLSGYDLLHYGRPVGLRWRIRAFLGIVPELIPGAIDRLGRSVPVSLIQPFKGCRPMGYLYGFCMFYRRDAIGGLRFDEELPTYAGEDRDFSSRVGRNSRLVLCGDLTLEHHCAPQSRASNVQRTYQAGFGTGRSFGRNASALRDYFEFVRVLLGEFLVDSLALCHAPSREMAVAPFARAGGFISGWRSFRREAHRKR